MTDMLERARAAYQAAMKRPFGEWAPEDMSQPWDRAVVRAALLAALDPEDHLLVEAVARGMCAELGLHADDWDADGMGAKIYKWQREASTARAAILSIKNMAQGVPYDTER